MNLQHSKSSLAKDTQTEVATLQTSNGKIIANEKHDFRGKTSESIQENMLQNNKGSSNNNNEAADKNMECAATVENSIELVDSVDTNLSNLQPEIPFAVSNCNVLQSVPISGWIERILLIF